MTNVTGVRKLWKKARVLHQEQADEIMHRFENGEIGGNTARKLLNIILEKQGVG